MKLVIVALSLLVATALCVRVFPEGRHAQHKGQKLNEWIEIPNQVRNLQQEREVIFAIKQQNTDKLEATFWDVSNPKSKNYGKFLSLDELTAMIAPSNEALTAIETFLQSHGITNYRLTRNRDFLHVKLSLQAISEVFEVAFSTYYHSSGRDFVGTLDSYSVPQEVAQHLDYVSGVVGLPDIHMNRPHVRPAGAPESGLPITPDVIRARYNISKSVAPKASGNSAAVVEFQYQFYSEADLKTFFTKFVPDHISCDTITNVYGQNNQHQPGTEASLDVQYLLGVAPCLATTDYYSAYQFNFFNDLTQWISFVANQTSPALVQSVSYGTQGNYPSSDYQTRQDQEFQKMGVRGISVVFASGDSGAECVGQCQLDPSYPAVSTFVTSIGSTAFITGNTGAERATSAFKSGGGFAYVQDRPAYQSKAVPAYFAQSIQFPPSHAYNSSKRGTPDFSALGDVEFQVIVAGRQFSIGGTSASAPSFSAVIALLNDLRMQNGKQSLGFLNTFLYQTAESNPNAFYDVTVGDNKQGCLPNACSPGIDGYLCSRGWDPVTGYGTPNYQELAKLV